jgi:type IV pilus assembly protein PilC
MVEKGIIAPFGAKELCAFTKQFFVMINAGVPILQTLEILVEQEKNLSLKKSLVFIQREVGEGKPLNEAMRTQKGFSRLYCNLIKAGEAGGILDTILQKLVEHLDKQEKIKSQIKSAMTYPSIVVVVGIGVIMIMMIFVVPQFTGMLTESGQKIPAVTQFVVSISDFCAEYVVQLLVGSIVGTVIFLNAIKSPGGKPVFDALIMKAPIFGEIIVKGNLASFTRTLATMLTSGVSLVDSLEICLETVDNTVIANDIKKIRKAVMEGRTLVEPLNKITYFPHMVASMVAVGEQTGELDGMLLKVADVFEEDVGNAITAMTKMIEPLIIVVLGGIVALILIAMYMPIFMAAGGTD